MTTIPARMVFSLLIFLTVSPALAFRADDEHLRKKSAAAPYAASQTAPLKTPSAGQKAALENLGAAAVAWDAKTGAPASIRGKDLSAPAGGKNISPLPTNDFAAALAVMENLSKSYRLRDAGREFSLLKIERDALGFRHVRLEQMHLGLKVVGGGVVVHFNESGRPYQVNGRYIPGIDLAPEKTIDEKAAVAAAQKDLVEKGKLAGALKGEIELVVYARNAAPVLAYELRLVYRDNRAGFGNWRYWVNARDGAILNCYNDVRKSTVPAAERSKYAVTISGTLLAGEGSAEVSLTGDKVSAYYYLYSPGNLWRIYDYPENTTARNNSADWPDTIYGRTEISAARNFNTIQAYYFQVHARHSYDNSYAPALANVRVEGDTDNAFWDPDAQAFYFYPGSYFADLTVLDVCAHEFTHAVTEHTADLIYQNESGALNESFSDIFAAGIEFASQPDGRSSYPERTAGYADWLIGEDCTYPYSTALRDMRNPRRYQDPSRYHGSYWYYGSGDNGGVHYNCGVQNHFFYLLAEGGSGNNDGASYDFTGIGITNAILVAYRALANYCTPDTDYAAARIYWISAAADLDSAWTGAVAAAWAAVGVKEEGPSPAPSYDLLRLGLNNDFDHDGRADYALYNFQTGQWRADSSGAARRTIAAGEQFGGYDYLPIPGDYDGDGLADAALYSQATGWWMIHYLGTGRTDIFQAGGNDLIPAPGDYDGDGATDLALYNSRTGAWHAWSSSNQTWLANGGIFGGYGYVPAPGDYNGGGQSDAVIYSNDMALWQLFYLETGRIEYCDFSEVFGADRRHVPAPGDYDGDGITDFGLYDYHSGGWYVWSRVNEWLLVPDYRFADYDGYYYRPVAGDYDGDGISDLAVYSPYYGDWHIYYMGPDTTEHLTDFGGEQYVPITYWALYGKM
ncbi:MAG: M4 family metallopeptidase [Kiritimatiellae bacterium]|nr:M4 family metallopeptidase [Kiritimatiellia bacterium]